MPASDWQAYGAAVRALVSEVWADATYTGWWNYVTEESRVIVGPVDDVDRVRKRLAELAREYGQDAIGLQVGEAELITAGVPA